MHECVSLCVVNEYLRAACPLIRPSAGDDFAAYCPKSVMLSHRRRRVDVPGRLPIWHGSMSSKPMLTTFTPFIRRGGDFGRPAIVMRRPSKFCQYSHQSSTFAILFFTLLSWRLRQHLNTSKNK